MFPSDGSNSDSEKPSKPAVTAASNASSQAAGVWQTGGSDNEDGQFTFTSVDDSYCEFWSWPW